jgi:hypothetical protein
VVCGGCHGAVTEAPKRSCGSPGGQQRPALATAVAGRRHLTPLASETRHRAGRTGQVRNKLYGGCVDGFLPSLAEHHRLDRSSAVRSYVAIQTR